jgi:hypothetical protein
MPSTGGDRPLSCDRDDVEPQLVALPAMLGSISTAVCCGRASRVPELAVQPIEEGRQPAEEDTGGERLARERPATNAIRKARQHLVSTVLQQLSKRHHVPLCGPFAAYPPCSSPGRAQQ